MAEGGPAHLGTLCCSSISILVRHWGESGTCFNADVSDSIFIFFCSLETSIDLFLASLSLKIVHNDHIIPFHQEISFPSRKTKLYFRCLSFLWQTRHLPIFLLRPVTQRFKTLSVAVLTQIVLMNTLSLSL